MKPMTELKEIVNPRHTALIIVDPQYDFCANTGHMAKLGLDISRIQAAVPRLNNFIQECRKADVMRVWIREIFAANKMLPNLKAIYGMGENWIIKESSPGIHWYEKMVSVEASEPVITKWAYDGFEDTELHLLLQSNSIKTLLMTGFTANTCVETTARHGFIKGYYIVAISDCTDAPTKVEFESAMYNIKTYFGKVATSEEIAALWKSLPPTLAASKKNTSIRQHEESEGKEDLWKH